MPSRLCYPAAPMDDVVDEYHGILVPDPYRPLENTGAPETAAWVAAQNALTSDWLATAAARGSIFRRLTAIWDHPRQSAPRPRGGRWFQLRNTGLQQQDVLYVMEHPDEDGRVLVDPHDLSRDGVVALAGLAVSHDGRRVAYATITAGSDWLTWRVRDVDTGAEHGDVVMWGKFSSAAWLPDGSGFLYGACDSPSPGRAYEETSRSHTLRLHRLGTPADDDEVVCTAAEHPGRLYAPRVSDDGSYLIVHVAESTDPRNRILIADLDGGPVRLRPLIGDFDAAYDFVGNEGSTCYIHTDCDAPRGRVIAVDADDPRPGAHREVIAESDHVLEDVRRCGDRLVTVVMVDASHRLRRHLLDGTPDGVIPLPDLATVSDLSGSAVEDLVFFSYTSFSRPTEIHQHDLRTGETRAHRPHGVDLDPALCLTTREFVTSPDGARVPVFLTRRRDVTPSGDVPALLWAYGGFGMSVTPGFRADWRVWVERGGLLAVAGVRGGGEYGRGWHDAARGSLKQRSIDDCLAVADHLVSSGWTRPERLALSGVSNGGLLAGACLTQRPQAFGAVVLEVAVLDMLRFHRFTIGWSWVAEYGSPDDPDDFPHLHAYSPLHRIRAGRAYPAVLLTTADHDDRVVPAHSLKFAAALQAAQKGDAPVLIRVQIDAGHGMGTPTAVRIAERADVLVFLYRALEVFSDGPASKRGEDVGISPAVS